MTQALIIGLSWALPWFIVEASIQPRGATWGLFAGSLVGAIIFGTFMTFVMRRQQKKGGGPLISAAIESAVRKGSLPKDADPQVWVPLLRTKGRTERRMLWIGPLEFGLATGLAVYLIVTEPAVSFWWVAAVLFLGLAIFMPIWTLRRLPRIDALIAELEEKASR